MPFCVGIDENGLGPQLGPLIVTAIAARVTDDAAQRMASEPQRFLHSRLADSKRIVSHGNTDIAEAWARAIVGDVETPLALIRKLSLDTIEALQSSCPREALPQCWPSQRPFRTAEAHVNQARRDLADLRALGVDIVWARCSITCVQGLNRARRNNQGRFGVDLQAMEALLIAAREFANEDVVASCGKIGGLMRYRNKFGLLSDYWCDVITEQASESAYLLVGLGKVRFVRDAEERDPLVALASLVGKWVREVFMDHIVTFYRNGTPALPNASGYHDCVTDKFVHQSKVLRERLGIPDDCFLREESRKR